MRFSIFRLKNEPHTFVVTEHESNETVTGTQIGLPGEELELIAISAEEGSEREGFDEILAKQAIEKEGYYKFHSGTFYKVG